MSNKTKAHTVYKLLNGERVPSVTTVLGILQKPALLEWAYQCGLKGEDYKAVRDRAGDIGTLAHYLIMCHLKGEKPDTGEYSAQDIDKAETCFLKYLEWEKGRKLTPVLVENAFVSEDYQFGGTVDFFGPIDGVWTLQDFKTGKAIYSEAFAQVAAYKHLIEECTGHRVDSIRILHIGRDETEGFEERVVNNAEKYWTLFQYCLAIYNLQKELKGEK